MPNIPFIFKIGKDGSKPPDTCQMVPLFPGNVPAGVCQPENDRFKVLIQIVRGGIVEARSKIPL